jgi:hypothetical protein
MRKLMLNAKTENRETAYNFVSQPATTKVRGSSTLNISMLRGGAKPIRMLFLSTFLLIFFSVTVNVQADCPPRCDRDWVERSIEITLPDYPDCPMRYTFRERNCDGEYQIDPVMITFLSSDCLPL